MLDNIIEQMQSIVALSSTAIAPSIIYQHRTNSSITEVTNTFATTKSLKNYKVEDEILHDAREFIISRHITIDDKLEFLNKSAKKNDTISYDGKIWYVVTAEDEDVELVLVCTANSQSIPMPNKKFHL